MSEYLITKLSTAGKDSAFSGLNFFSGLFYEARDSIAALEAENARLREALEPFKREAWSYEPDDGDDDLTLWGNIKITLGDLRRARAALASNKHRTDTDKSSENPNISENSL